MPSFWINDCYVLAAGSKMVSEIAFWISFVEECCLSLLPSLDVEVTSKHCLAAVHIIIMINY